ncbi:tetratricopeptide repeat protein (plasmid) [Nostoc sp. UHCC 0870]|uniref:tetratricopeptide repeat protein n=1 Tax=Nostoc sp. UHCC 0870 TaxID=2914041 RepID=UPI001EDCF3A7|nr:tetratricopeptide repeat protein [Nostoc sp. UHCC 0870]UKP01311.1 tetratricopeptide repeat protein [Nostoc sp. UHCC 0870]
MQKPGVFAISAVAGMGGVGKTELAIKYAWEHEADYPGGICWLSARESKESNLAVEIVHFAQLYMKLKVPQNNLQGKLLNPTEQVAWCWQNWKPLEGLVLVILDDVTNLETCREFLPKGKRFCVLMTTRLRNLDTNIQEIPLDVLSPQEALELLTALVGEKLIQKELQTAKELCEWFGYLPLGLELIGRYLAKKPPHWTLAKMLQRLEEQRLEDEAINHCQQQTLSTAQRGVLAAFELSWLELNPMTQLVGKLLSLFAPDIFRWEWVESASSLLNLSSTEIETANQQLYDRHLIVWVEDKDTDVCYKIHPLIRKFLKVKLDADFEQADALKQQFCRVMVNDSKLVPQSPTQDVTLRVNTAVPHIVEAATRLNEWLKDEDFCYPFVALGRFYADQGIYHKAEYWYKQYLSVSQTRFGEEHIEVACSLNNLALLYCKQGRYIDAQPLFQRALELNERLSKEMYPYVATTLNNLGLLYCEQGRPFEAEPLFQKALAIREESLGKDHPEIATILNNLAYFYFSLDEYNKAKKLLEKALKIREKSIERNPVALAIILNNLAHIYEYQERYMKAKDLYNEALEIRTSFLGDKHLDVAQSLNNLGVVHAKQKRYEEAKFLLKQALEIFDKCVGDRHRYTVSTRASLSNICDDQS